jgi:hypothetical protein
MFVFVHNYFKPVISKFANEFISFFLFFDKYL